MSFNINKEDSSRNNVMSSLKFLMNLEIGEYEHLHQTSSNQSLNEKVLI